VAGKRSILNLVRVGRQSAADLDAMVAELCEVAPEKSHDECAATHWSRRFAASGKALGKKALADDADPV
jgi:hypothetical protein